MNREDVLKWRNDISSGLSDGKAPTTLSGKELEKHFRFLKDPRNGSNIATGLIKTGDTYSLQILSFNTPGSRKAAVAIAEAIGEGAVATHVENSFMFQPLSFRWGFNPKNPLLTHHSPPVIGCELAVKRALGTVCGFVANDNGEDEILTGQHVFGAVEGCRGNKVIAQPKGFLWSKKTIARSHPSEKLHPYEKNYAEAATGYFVAPHVGGHNILPKIGSAFDGHTVTLPPDDQVFDAGTEVFKIGKSSGVTQGTILSPLTDFYVKHRRRKGGVHRYLFGDGVSIEASPGKRFAVPGDSGGLIFAPSGTENVVWALGMVSAGARVKSRTTGLWTNVVFSCSLPATLTALKRTWK